MKRITIGLDIAKSVFQVHGEDSSGKIVLQKRLRRSQVLAFFAGFEPALIGIEACGSAHYWGRELRALGHDVRLIPAAYVKPFVRRNKNDARDAAAICTAVGRSDMRFVAIKSVESQASRGLERSRELLVRQHTQLMNSVRSQLAELGIVAAPGRRGFAELSQLVAVGDERIPAMLLSVLSLMLQQIDQLRVASAAIEAKIMAVAKADPAMRRLATIPGIGGLTAHAIVTAIGDGTQFASSRDFAAWCGLTPRGASSGLKRREGGISRQGDIRLRKLLALGASTIIRSARSRADRATQWQRGILARRPVKVAVLAQAAKTATIAWAVLTAGTTYRRPLPNPSQFSAVLAPSSPLRAVSDGDGLTALARDALHSSGRDEGMVPPVKQRNDPASLSDPPHSPLLAIRPDTRKEHQAAPAKWSGPGSRHSASSSCLKSAPQCSEPDPRNPSGPAVSRPRQQAGYMTAPDHPPTPPNSPCPKGAVHT
jgi:transposase